MDDIERIRDQHQRILAKLAVFDDDTAIRVYQKNEMIYFQDDLADFFYYIKSGRVRTYAIINNDTDKRIMTYEEGMVFGLPAFFNHTMRPASAAACCRSEIVQVDEQRLQELLKDDGELTMSLFMIMGQELTGMTRQAIAASGEHADTRIARYILRKLRNIKIRTGVASDTIHITQDVIASQFGYSRATINRTLRGFADKGWISIRYAEIRVLNPDALFAFALDRRS